MEVRPSPPADPDMGVAGLLSAAAPLSRAESPPISVRAVASQKNNMSAAHRRRVGLTADKKRGWQCRPILLHVQPASNIPNSMVRTREMGSCLAKFPSVVLRYLWARFGDFPAARRSWPSHDVRVEGRGPHPPLDLDLPAVGVDSPQSAMAERCNPKASKYETKLRSGWLCSSMTGAVHEAFKVEFGMLSSRLCDEAGHLY
jgi:hypothetical protein